MFQRFRETHIKLGAGKWRFLQKGSRYLGNMVSPEGTICGLREAEGRMEMAVPEEQARYKEIPGPMYLLQAVNLRLRQNFETAYRTQGGEVPGRRFCLPLT
jgi:hypothetical protein